MHKLYLSIQNVLDINFISKEFEASEQIELESPADKNAEALYIVCPTLYLADKLIMLGQRSSKVQRVGEESIQSKLQITHSTWRIY